MGHRSEIKPSSRTKDALQRSKGRRNSIGSAQGQHPVHAPQKSKKSARVLSRGLHMSIEQHISLILSTTDDGINRLSPKESVGASVN